MPEFPTRTTIDELERAVRDAGVAGAEVRRQAVQPVEADVLEQWRVAVNGHDDARVAQLVLFAHALRDVGQPLLGQVG